MTDGITCIYWGIFFDPDQLPMGQLEQDIEYKHVTFAFRQPCPEDLVGQKVDVDVVGYANDGANEAYRVELPNYIEEFYKNENPPHITLSVSNDGRPKDSGLLPFEDIGEPFSITGTIGYFTDDEYFF